MDRSSCRNGFVRAWVAACALLLPACSDVSSPGSEAQDDPVAPVKSSVAAEMEYQPGGPAVVLVSHQFAPPPIPEVDDDDFSPAQLSESSQHAIPELIRRLPEVQSKWGLREHGAGAFGGAQDNDVALSASPPNGMPGFLIWRLPDVEASDCGKTDKNIWRLPPLSGHVATHEPPSESEPPVASQPDLTGDVVGATEAEQETPIGNVAVESPPSGREVVESPGPAIVGPATIGTTLMKEGASAEKELDADALAREVQADDSQVSVDLSGEARHAPDESQLSTSDASQLVMRRLPPLDASPFSPHRGAQPGRADLLVGSTADAEPVERTPAPGGGEWRAAPAIDALPPRDEAGGDFPLRVEAATAPVHTERLVQQRADAQVLSDQPTMSSAQGSKSWLPVSVPVVPMESAAPEAPPRRDSTYEVISRRVVTLSQKAESLASRGAYYAARAEMIKALRVITQSLDTQQGGTQHGEALARAMRAFKETDDFAPRGSQLEGELNLAQIITGHRTPVLKDVQVDHLAPLAVQQKYLEYAQEQFAQACDDLPVGSFALYGLARIYSVMEHARIDTQVLCLPKAVTLHQAALLVDAENVLAANELGVLLAQFGQLEDARRVLLHALAIQPRPEIWLNVAAVHQRLGESDLARQAQQQGTLMASRQTARTTPADAAPAVQWVDAKTFSDVRPGPGQ